MLRPNTIENLYKKNKSYIKKYKLIAVVKRYNLQLTYYHFFRKYNC